MDQKFIEEPIKVADLRYLSKAGTNENHHITPLFLGGTRSGETRNIPSSYHQLITNEFKGRDFGYGKLPPTPTQLQELLDDVCKKYPLPR